MNSRTANPQSTTRNPQSQKVRFFWLPFSVFFWIIALALGPTPVRAAVSFTISPSVVSNTYNGTITLQISGLTNGVTNVLVQKYLDVNSNNIIDSADLLVQQFQLTAAQSNVFMNEATVPPTPVVATNFFPCDTSSTTNGITIPLNFQNGDFAQTLVGQYLFKVTGASLPNTAVTNSLVVNNSFFSTCVTGAVAYAEPSGPGLTTNVSIPNAIVLLWTNQTGPIHIQGGTIANSNGDFSLRVPAGTYFFTAGKSNYVSVVSQAPPISAKSTNDFPIYVIPAMTNITGRVINSANSTGLGGVSGVAQSETNGYISFYFTSTNGYFYAPVASDLWAAPADLFACAFQGCLGWQTNLFLNVSNKAVNFTNSLPPMNAIFYGGVSNSAGAPMPGVYLYAIDNAGHQSIGMTDSQGKYVVGVSAETNQWVLYIPPTDNPGLTNPYVINLPFLRANVGTNQAIEQNFNLEYAPYTISGTVEDVDDNPIAGAEVFATNDQYQAFSAVTASDGTYTLNVSLGTWTVGVSPVSLESLGYTDVANFPPNQTATVSDSDPSATVNFSLLICGEVGISTTNLPDAMVGQYYNTSFSATSCQSITNWSTAYGVTLTSLYDQTNVTYPAGTAIYSDSGIIGYVETYFSFGVNANVLYSTNCTIGSMARDSNSEFQWANVSATVTVSGPITNTYQFRFPGDPYSKYTLWTILPTTQSGPPYSTTITVPLYPPNNTEPNPFIYFSGEFKCLPGTLLQVSGTSNRVASVISAFHSIPTVGDSAVVPSSIPYTNRDNSVVWIQSGANFGQYTISAYGPQTNNLDGLTLYPDGTLAGTPATSGTFNFSVMAEDTSSNVTVQPFTLVVFPATGISAASSAEASQLQSSNTFQMRLTGLTNAFNYTVLMSTNLASANWVPIYTVNNPTTNMMTVPDTAATNATRFYRVQVSQ